MSHLENIATRQRHSLVRDTLFVTLVALATVVCASTVGQAVHASSAGPVVKTAPLATR